jgi:hypothetical protein
VFCFGSIHWSTPEPVVGRSLAIAAAVSHGPLQTAHAQSKFCITSGNSKVGGP